MKIGAKIGIYAAVLVVSFGVTVGIMYGVRPDDPYAETEQDHMINSLFDTLSSSELEGSVVVNANGEDTVIDFAGTLGLDINNIALDTIYADLTLEVNFPSGSDLVAGIQYEDSTIYLEYNLGADNEIDMYMNLSCLDDISLVLEMLGVGDLSLDSLMGDLDLDELGDAIENMPYIKKKGDTPAHFELDLFGATFNLECDKKYNFLGGIWSTIETNSGYVDINLTLLPYEGEELVAVPYSASWVPLDLLVSALGNTLIYPYYEFTGDFTMEMSVEVDLDQFVSGTNLGTEVFDVLLGFKNMSVQLGISDGFDMIIDYDVIMSQISYTFMGFLNIDIPLNGNSNTHYYNKNDEATEFYSTTLNSRHQTIYYSSTDGYIYVYSEDDLTFSTALFFGSTATGQDVRYGKFTSKYFFDNIMDIIIFDLLGISTDYSDMILEVMGDTDLSSISFDVSGTFWENILPELSYAEAHTETETVEVTDETTGETTEETITTEVPDRFTIDVDLGTMMGDDPLLNDIVLILDLIDSGDTKILDRLYVGANMFGADIAIDLTLTHDSNYIANVVKWTSFLSKVSSYIENHADDDVNEWYDIPCYTQDEPATISS